MPTSELTIRQACNLLDRGGWALLNGALCNEHEARGRLVTEVTIAQNRLVVKSGELSFSLPANRVWSPEPWQLYFGHNTELAPADTSLVLLNPCLQLTSQIRTHSRAIAQREARISKSRPDRERVASLLTELIEGETDENRVVRRVRVSTGGFTIDFANWSLPLRVTQNNPDESPAVALLVTAELWGQLQESSHKDVWWINAGQGRLSQNLKAQHLSTRLSGKALAAVTARDDGVNLLFADGTRLPVRLEPQDPAAPLQLQFHDSIEYLMNF